MRILIIVLSLRIYLDAVPIEESTTIPTTIQDTLEAEDGDYIKKILKNNATRRIIGGKETYSNKPYMVYLKVPTVNQKHKNYRNWICAGVIITPEYILTSAACIEDIKYFYVVAGKFNHNSQDRRETSLCLKNGSKRAVWKCVPKNYVFDTEDNDNLKWMNNDIAIVKVEDEFDFTRRIKGCDFIPKPIAYNNQSDTMEEPGTVASIAGWGTTSAYGELADLGYLQELYYASVYIDPVLSITKPIGKHPTFIEDKSYMDYLIELSVYLPSFWISSRRQTVEHPLMDVNVILISKKACKSRWGPRYHNIIQNYMICTRDLVAELSTICTQKFTECRDIIYEDDVQFRRFLKEFDKNNVTMFPHYAYHNDTYSRRLMPITAGGFCENDHGGPLVYGEGVDAVVIGIISACLVKERTNKCYGPFLYTSVYKNRILINCSVNKAVSSCDKLYRSGGNDRTEETISWKDHPDGPSKPEIEEMNRRRAKEIQQKQGVTIENSEEYANSSENFQNVNISNEPTMKANVTPETTQATVITTNKNV